MIDVHEPHLPEIASEATRGEEYHPTIKRQTHRPRTSLWSLYRAIRPSPHADCNVDLSSGSCSLR
jgi:hypothetical protein